MAIEFYNKAQMNAIANKIGLAIKAQFAKLGTAAFKNVGVSSGQVPLVENAYKAAFTSRDNYYNGNANVDANNFERGTRHLVFSSNANMPPVSDFYLIETLYNYSDSTKLQKAWGYNKTSMFIRALNGAGNWTPWRETAFNGTSPDFVSIQVGTGAPKIAFTKVIAITPASGTNNNVQIDIAHGLTIGKISSCQGFIEAGTKRVPIPFNDAGVNYNYVLSGGNISVSLTNPATADIYGKTVTFFVTYEA